MLTIIGVIVFILVLSVPTYRLIKSRAVDYIRENIGLTLIAGVTLFNLYDDIPHILFYFLSFATIIVLLFLVIGIFNHKSD